MNNIRQKKWIHKRHKIIRNILAPLFSLICRFKYGFTRNLISDSDKRQYLIVMNHQTPFDEFFVSLNFKCPVYFVATEDIFSLGFISRLLEWAVAPIPIKKSTQDLSAIKNIMQVVKEGGTICIFPEGNRTYSGCTEYIKPAITKLIKMTGLPVILMNLQGGYGKEPRWSTKSRKGKVTCTVKRIIEADEYKQMSPADFYNAVTQDLYINDTNSESSFKSKNRAEYAERLLYVCPVCGVSSFFSNGNIISCKKCGLSAEFTEKLKIKPCDSNQQILPYTTIKEWYDSQEHFIENLNLQNYQDTPAFSEKVRLYKVRLYKKKILIDKDCALDLFSNRYEIIYSSEKIIMNYDEVKAVSVLGRNKLNIYFKNEVFQIKSDKRFNAVKYLHFYHHYKNTKSERETKGDGHEFLGL